MAPRAWIMDNEKGDQRLPHKAEGPDNEVSGEMLIDLGVLYWKLDADKYENDPKLEKIRNDRGYDYQDIVTVSPDKLPNYETKLKMFYEEHIHTAEEIRYVLEGSGYFDVRDREDRWIRIEVNKGDMIVLPEGIYHRFTLDTNNYIKAMRLFRGDPIWNQLVRPQDENPSRIKYINATPEELKMPPPPLCT